MTEFFYITEKRNLQDLPGALMYYDYRWPLPEALMPGASLFCASRRPLPRALVHYPYRRGGKYDKH
jgi:hypothetical protein